MLDAWWLIVFPGLAITFSTSPLPRRRRTAPGGGNPHRTKIAMAQPNLLEIRGLSIRFRTEDGMVDAVKNISLSLKEGGSLAIVGRAAAAKA